MAIIVEQSTVCAVMAFSRDRFVSDVFKTSKVLQKWWSRVKFALKQYA
jgi:hypothetical protein